MAQKMRTGKRRYGGRVCCGDVRYITVGKWSGLMTADLSGVWKVVHSRKSRSEKANEQKVA